MTIELRDRGKQRGTFAANGVAINSYERFAALLAKGMEAVTLLVAVVLPMVISPFADAYFEVPKAFFVRVTALAQGVLLLGWAGSTWLGRRRRGLPLWGGDGVEVLRRQMICAALALAGVSLLTAVTAVNRGYAMVGCPQRGGGALSVLSGVIFFIAAAVSLRRRVQGERVVAAISMGCLPCVVFALCEMVGVHPMGFNIKGVGWRLSGSLGNANFLGSFFALTTPLVAGTAWQAWRRGRVVTAAIYLITALLLVVGIAVSQSRGPLLALLAASVVAGLLLLAAAGRLVWSRRLATGAIVGCVLALLAFNYTIVEPLRNGDLVIGSHSGILRSGSVVVRLNIYKTIAERMLSNEPLRAVDNSIDPLHTLRFWAGYGPQNLMVACEQFFPAILEKLESDNVGIDTAHCLLLETWIESGVIGVLAWGAFFIFAVIIVTRSLGLAHESQRLWQVCGMIIGGAGLFALLLALFWGAWAWGFGFAIGTIVGVLYAVHWLSGKGAKVTAQLSALVPATSLLVFLFDAQVGVMTVTVATFAMLMLGVLQASLHSDGELGHDEKERDKATDSSGGATSPWLIAVLALAVATTANCGLMLNHTLSADIFTVWREVVFSAMGLPAAATVILGVLLIADAAKWRKSLLWPAMLLIAGWLCDTVLRSKALAQVFGTPLVTTEVAIRFAMALLKFEWWRYVLMTLAAGGVAVACTSRSIVKIAVAIVVAVVVAVAVSLMFNIPQVGMAAQGPLAAAKFFEAAERRDLAAAQIWQAIGNSVWDDVYYSRLHTIYGNSAHKQYRTERETNQQLYQLAEQMLDRACLAAPYDPRRLIGYGKLYQLRASEFERGSKERLEMGQRALKVFSNVTHLVPLRSSMKIEVAITLMDLLGDYKGAERELVAILESDPDNARAAELLAYTYLHLGKQVTGSDEQASLSEKSGKMAQQALASPWRQRQRIDVRRLTAIARESARSREK